MSNTMHKHHRAFTIVELLVTIGLIVLLVSLALVALGGLRNAANRSDTLGALRQLAVAWTTYSTDHRQDLMPGFIHGDFMDDMSPDYLGIEARLPDGAVLDQCDSNGICDSSGYVWRLAPYYGNAWDMTLSDYKSKEAEGWAEAQYQAGEYGPGTPPTPVAGGSEPEFPGIANAPSIGMNSIFVGGDSYHGGTFCNARNPWAPDAGLEDEILAATRYTEIKNPSQLILFAPTLDPDYTGSANMEPGYVELRPPFIEVDAPNNDGTWSVATQQWGFLDDGIETTMAFESEGGIPYSRWGDTELPLAHVDGSTMTEDFTNLAPRHPMSGGGAIPAEGVPLYMKRWAPFVTTGF